MARQLQRAANRPLLVTRINLWWYALALIVIMALGWLALNNLIPGMFLPLVLFASIFWLTSFVMAVIAKLRTPKDAPESRK